MRALMAVAALAAGLAVAGMAVGQGLDWPADHERFGILRAEGDDGVRVWFEPPMPKTLRCKVGNGQVAIVEAQEGEMLKVRVPGGPWKGCRGLVRRDQVSG